MIDRIFQAVKTYSNEDFNGNIRPLEYENILHSVIEQKYEELLFNITRLTNSQNRGLINGGMENLVDKEREKLQYYLVPAKTLAYSGGLFTLPADLRYFDVVLYRGTAIEMLKSGREFKYVETTEPDISYPVGLRQGNTIKVLPIIIEADVTVEYLRNPKRGKWTYQVVNGVEVFNPAADDYQDVDIHPGEEADIIIRVLQGFGINLKEEDIKQITQTERAFDFNQENRL